jgi:hypothetical protein
MIILGVPVSLIYRNKHFCQTCNKSTNKIHCVIGMNSFCLFGRYDLVANKIHYIYIYSVLVYFVGSFIACLIYKYMNIYSTAR